MEISHVLRAEEWLPSAPRHKELYAALGYEMPMLAHLPIILGPDRSKLSKRHGATSVLHYRDNGYLPDAMELPGPAGVVARRRHGRHIAGGPGQALQHRPDTGQPRSFQQR